MCHVCLLSGVLSLQFSFQVLQIHKSEITHSICLVDWKLNFYTDYTSSIINIIYFAEESSAFF